jgi:hypothetical protein
MDDVHAKRPNRELVVVALYLVGGDVKKVHTEDVAIKCHELFPDSFSWVRHPEFPDKDIVRVSLIDARKEKFGALVEGRSGQNMGLSRKSNRNPTDDGWVLTTKGVEWAQANISRFTSSASASSVKAHRQEILRQLKRITDHTLYKNFANGSDTFEPSIGELADLFRCRVDADLAVWHGRFADAKRLAEAAQQANVLEFLSKCETAYQRSR